MKLLFFLIILNVIFGFYNSFRYYTSNQTSLVYLFIISLIIHLFISFVYYKFQKIYKILKISHQKILKIYYSDLLFILLFFSLILTPAQILYINALKIDILSKLNLPIKEIHLPGSRSSGELILYDKKNKKRYSINTYPQKLKELKIGDIYNITIYKGWLGIEFYKTNFFGYETIELKK